MIPILIFLLIISIILCGFLYRKNHELKKEVSYYREADRMKDELKESSGK